MTRMRSRTSREGTANNLTNLQLSLRVTQSLLAAARSAEHEQIDLKLESHPAEARETGTAYAGVIAWWCV